MPGAARYGQGCRAGSTGLYLAADAGRGKPVSGYESGLSLQRAVNGNDSQPWVKLSKTGVKLSKTGTNAKSSSYRFPRSSHHVPPCPYALFGRRGGENGQQSRSREGGLGWSGWKCLGGPRQGPPELRSWVGGKLGGEGDSTGLQEGAQERERGVERFGRYAEVPGLIGAPHNSETQIFWMRIWHVARHGESRASWRSGLRYLYGGCNNWEQQRWDQRSESAGKESQKENTRRQQKRGGQRIWWWEWKSRGGQARGLLKVRDHKGSR